MYVRFEERASTAVHACLDYKINEVLYVNAVAWKSSNYKQFWPYKGGPIESSYFQAKVTKCKEACITLQFSAFELGRTVYYNSSWLKRYATRVLPQNSTLISRQEYELYEAHDGVDGVSAERNFGEGDC